MADNRPHSDIKNIFAIIRDINGLGVTNERGYLVGILTIQDLIEALFYLAEMAEKRA